MIIDVNLYTQKQVSQLPYILKVQCIRKYNQKILDW